MNKWSRTYWLDLGERVASTLVGAVLAQMTIVSSVPHLSWSNPTLTWSVLGVPTATTLLKGLLANLPGEDASASLVGVTSENVQTPVAVDTSAESSSGGSGVGYAPGGFVNSSGGSPTLPASGDSSSNG